MRMPDRPIKSPFTNAAFKNHAEEMVINTFVKAIDAKFPNPLDIKGKLYTSIKPKRSMY
jgi:hypothetical protein